MRELIFTFLLSLFVQQLYSQNFEDLLSKADSAYDAKDFKLSANYFEKAIKLNPQAHSRYYYNAACSFSLAKDTNKALKYLEYSFERGSNADYAIFDSDLYNISEMGSFKSLIEKYGLASNDSVIYYTEIIDMMLKNKSVTITKKTIVFPPFNQSMKPYFAKIGFQDSVLRLPTTSLRIDDCILVHSLRNISTPITIEDLELKSLQIESSSFSDISFVYLIMIKNSSFKNLDIYNIDTRVYISESIIGNLSFTGTKFRERDSEFRLSHSTINDILIHVDNYKNILIHDNLFDYQVKTKETIGVESYFTKPPVLILGNFETLELKNNQIQGLDSLKPYGLVSPSCNKFILRDNKISYPVSFANLKIADKAEIVDNKFIKVDFSATLFPEFTTYVPFRQLDRSTLSIINIPVDKTDTLSSISTSNDLGFEDHENFEKLIYQYQKLYNNYRFRGELESANQSYIAIKNLRIDRYKIIRRIEPSAKNYFRLRISQLLGFYVEHGTNPAKAIVISFYILILFAVFYFFFPSEWDTTSKARLIANFKDFTQKNDKGYIKPFFVMLGGFTLSLINALTLSLNSFVTLGFGSIPTKGLARYVCIIQGFIGWFLLSIFTVALINQVLA